MKMKINLNEFTRPLLSEAEIERRYARIVAVRRVLWVVLALAVLAWPLGAGEHGAGLAIAWATKLGIWAVPVILLSSSLQEIEATSTATYHWLPPSYCDDMAALCEKEPSLVAYRDRVRELGRRFTLGEFYAMRKWLAAREQAAWDAEFDAKEREACQRLYGVPSTEAGV